MLRRILKVLAALLAVLAAAAALVPLLVSRDSVAPDAPARLPPLEGGAYLEVPVPGAGDVALHYLRRPAAGGAAAPTLLLLHGFTFNLTTWLPQLEGLAAHGPVVAYDQIPYGLSAKPVPGEWSGPSPYTRAGAQARLLALMDGLGIQRALLVGNSSGGTLALDLALDHPERVAGLVLVAPWVYVQRPTFPRWVTELPQMERLSLFLARLLGGRGGLLGLSYADEGRITPERRELARLHMGVQHWDLAWGALLNRSLADPVTVAPRLPEVDVPVLLVTGDRDRLVPPEDTRRVAELVPGADLQVIPGCGHVPHEECPEAFGRVVDAWLEERPWAGI